MELTLELRAESGLQWVLERLTPTSPFGRLYSSPSSRNSSCSFTMRARRSKRAGLASTPTRKLSICAGEAE